VLGNPILDTSPLCVDSVGDPRALVGDAVVDASALPADAVFDSIVGGESRPARMVAFSELPPAVAVRIRVPPVFPQCVVAVIAPCIRAGRAIAAHHATVWPIVRPPVVAIRAVAAQPVIAALVATRIRVVSQGRKR
jgi:hypothetical protein